MNVSENGTYTAPSGVDGYSPVKVNVPKPVLELLNIISNGTYTPPSGVDGYDEVVVNVPPIPPSVTSLNVTENGTYTPPTGVDGYDEVVVNVPTNDPNIILNDRVLMQSQSNAQINYDDNKTLETDKYYLFAFKLLANNGQYYYQNFIVKWANATIRLEFRNYFEFSIDVYEGYIYIAFTAGATPYTFNGKITELNNTFIYN